MKALPVRHRAEHRQSKGRRKRHSLPKSPSPETLHTSDDSIRPQLQFGSGKSSQLVNVFISGLIGISAEEVEKLKARMVLRTSQQISELTSGSFVALPRNAAEVTRLTGRYQENALREGRPSERAHMLAHQLILWLTDVGFRHGVSDVYVDQDDALRLQWSSGERQVKMVFPFIVDEKPYLYHSSVDEFDVEPDPRPEQILSRLKWVFDQDQSRQRKA